MLFKIKQKIFNFIYELTHNHDYEDVDIINEKTKRLAGLKKRYKGDN